MAAAIGNQYAVGNNGGAPTKYKEEYNEQAYKLCLLGATDAELADFFEVHVDTIQEWKKTHDEFSYSVKKGKYAADAEIAKSLYNRAMGITLEKEVAVKLTTKEYNEKGKYVQTEKIEVVKVSEQIPPDPTSTIFWLKNRQPKEWRDKQEVDHTTQGEKINGPMRVEIVEPDDED